MAKDVPFRRVLVWVRMDHDFGRQIYRGVASFTHSRPGWSHHVIPIEYPPTRLSQDPQVDALVGSIGDRTTARQLLHMELPTVNVSGRCTDLPFPQVITDDAAIGRIASQHFLNRGIRLATYVGMDARYAWSARRATAFRDDFAAGGGTFMDPPVMGQSREASIRDWLPRSGPTIGVLAGTDNDARRVVNMALSIGRRVPEDVAVCGVENDELICELNTVPISSIKHDGERIGYEAAKLLARIIDGGRPPSKPMIIPPLALIARRSSDVLAIDDADTVQAIRFIREHAHQGINVDGVLREVPISRRALEMRFAKYLGHSPAEEIRRLRIEKATRLLRETVLPMPDIAKACGFLTADHFSKVIARELGMRPTEYRRKNAPRHGQ